MDAWAIIEPAPDLPGTWVAHVLDVDVVTQGTSPREARRMAVEAAQLVVADDLGRGLDPGARRAPERYWRRLQRLRDEADPAAPARVTRLKRVYARTIRARPESPRVAARVSTTSAAFATTRA